MRKKNFYIGDLFFGVILMIGAAIVMWTSARERMPVDASLFTAPGILPFIFAFLIFLMGGFVVWQSIRENELRNLWQIVKDKKKLLSNTTRLIIYYDRILIIVLTTTIYIIFLFGRVNYLVGTFTFLFVTIIGIYRGNILKILFISLLGTIIIFTFVVIFGFPIP